MGYIYKITNTVSGKCYIGESKEKDVANRWKAHIRTIDKSKGCPALRDAVKKYGWDKFKFEILIICFDEDGFKYETYYIKKFNSQVPNGYNITPGGEGGGFIGKKHTEETKQRISNYFKEYYSDPENRKKTSLLVKESMKGINISERMRNSEKWKKAKERMSELRKGKTLTEDIKQKIRESVLKYYNDNPNRENIKKKLSEKISEYYKNNPKKKYTDEEKKQIGEKAKNYYKNEENREKHAKNMAETMGIKVSQYTKEGEFINTFRSVNEAQRQTGIHHHTIKMAYKGEQKLGGGYIWKLYNNHNK
jgi:group I intron endonuclease